MKNYFYILEGRRVGPLSFDEITAVPISEETLVWYDGLKDWQSAGELDEFRQFFHPIKGLETKVEESSSPIDDLELIVEKEQIFAQPAPTEDHFKTAVNNLPLIKNNEEREPEAYYTEQPHGIDDPFRNGSYESIYPAQAMFSAPFSFKGRIRRTEYWLSLIIAYAYLALVAAFLAQDHEASEGGGIAYLLFLIPFYWFVFAQNTKRCHDRGNSGWFQIIPLYGLWMAFGSSDRFVNQYGPNPKGVNLQPRF
ncbi:DUF805 domain-containing protein [Sphingobacterium paludis]|jgi:uncharacterized membrane protein YhaH (DUF805 family)|uniref:Uncharacterized membrane protein YhaH (DUF805 family) n=1 Tax=Sphingobacterium paludis TaxID=1476465 RepID=A0A4R7CXD4_9SPHI|nr:DUF805 domain-containing protein [Sphingobacterium paludis]TDS12361.1 uncharacterized membrane protein YhaH (DUF805 family) [Sphingobacterium paludis]